MMMCNLKVVLLSIFVLSTYIAIAGDPSIFNYVSTTQQPAFFQITEEHNKRLTSLESQISQLQEALQNEKKRNDQLTEQLQKNVVEIHINESLPKNCKEVMDRGNRVSGTYIIQPKSRPFTVLCDMNTKLGGWAVFQRRLDGSQDFFLYWDNCKYGFGDFSGEFWLGLEHLHELTESGDNELLVELTDLDHITANASYGMFRISSEKEAYAMTLEGFRSGSAGDSLFYHNGMKFSTRDREHDVYDLEICAVQYTGAWWYKYCLWSNLNGRYLKSKQLKGADKYTGVVWHTFRGSSHSLLKSKMMVRPH